MMMLVIVKFLSRLHPYLAQKDLLAYCKEKGIILAAYTPTGEYCECND